MTSEAVGIPGRPGVLRAGRKGYVVGPGVVLMVLGAILAFAVRSETPGVDIQTVGVILMVAGAAVIAHARHGTRHEHSVTRVEEDPDNPELPTHTVREHVVDREIP